MILNVGAKHVAIIVIAILCGVLEALAHMAQWGITLPFHLTASVCLATVVSLGMVCKDIRDVPTNTRVTSAIAVAELPSLAQAIVPVVQAAVAPAPVAQAPGIIADMAPALAALEKKG